MMFTREDYQQRHGMLSLAHHMTAVKNLSGIFQEGALLSFNAMLTRSYENLAMMEVQARRATVRTPNDRLLHDYVPLYFSFKTPMAAKRQDRNSQWVYLTFKIDEIARAVPDLVVSDGNASSLHTRLQMIHSLADFDMVDKKAVYSVKYGHDHEIARKKAAELLVPDRLSLDFLLSITAIDAAVAAEVEQVTKPFRRQFNLKITPSWFFTAAQQPREGDFFV